MCTDYRIQARKKKRAGGYFGGKRKRGSVGETGKQRRNRGW